MELFLNIFLFYLIIINICFINSLKTENYSLVFPFKTISKEDPDITSSVNITLINKVMENILFIDIFINLEIGSPLQSIFVRMSANSDDFFISKENTIYEEKYSKKNGSFYYNQFNSTTFSYLYEDRGRIYYSHPHISEYVQDNFIFHSTKHNDINKILIKNFTFLLAFKVNGPHHGIVGLKGEISENMRREDIFRALKKYNLIKNDIWYLKYDDNNKKNGSLFIGNYPHNDKNIDKKGKNEIFTINHFRKVYSTINKNSWESQWGLTFSNIYLNNITVSPNIYEEILEDCKNCKNAVLNPNIGVIIGPTKYKFLLEKTYLNKFLNNKICFQPMLKVDKNYQDKSFYYYYCYASYLDEMKKNFMPIVLEHKEFNYNFTINFEDLYVRNNNYIFLKIIFEIYQNTNWILGEPFTRKYLLFFDSDSKEIGFYSNNINDNLDKQKKEKNGDSIFVVFRKIIIGIALIILGIYIGKKLFGLRRKLRANELEEKFEYKPASEKFQLV